MRLISSVYYNSHTKSKLSLMRAGQETTISFWLVQQHCDQEKAKVTTSGVNKWNKTDHYHVHSEGCRFDTHQENTNA